MFWYFAHLLRILSVPEKAFYQIIDMINDDIGLLLRNLSAKVDGSVNDLLSRLSVVRRPLMNIKRSDILRRPRALQHLGFVPTADGLTMTPGQ